ncbi:hypothetical protein [Treponema socranskii]|nr:hypothetical protein [Treponema socranskii]
MLNDNILITFDEKIQKSPFRNIYWFARYLIDTDKYGGIGKNKEKELVKIAEYIENLLKTSTLANDDKVLMATSYCFEQIKSFSSQNSKRYLLYENFISKIQEELKTTDDLIVFCMTIKYVISPINRSLENIPSDDKEFSQAIASSLLKKQGEKKVGLIISVWDDLGIKGCLDIERKEVVETFCNLIDKINLLEIEHDSVDDSIIMTAFVQEFERRLGQKRKSRGGKSLEDVTSFLFDFYKFKSSEGPEHLDFDFEVDKWFKCKDGWTIGISCKRTLRERWKQISLSTDILSKKKIKEIWHLITLDNDLSDDKIVTLGSQRQRFYLLDDSQAYIKYSKNEGTKDYVRPLSNLIKDIRNNIK